MTSSPDPGARRRFPLYVHLSVLFSALVLLSGSAIAWLGYLQSRDVALAAAEEVFGHVERETQSSLRETLAPVAQLAELLALQPVVRARTLEARVDALPSLRLALSGAAPVAAAYVGYDDGGFFLLRPLRSDAERAFFKAPAGAAFLLQSVDFPEGARRSTFVFFDDALAQLERRVPEAFDFDPRTRPWYRLAADPGKRVLTDPYVFFTTRSPGVTVAIRTASASVVGVDVTLDQVGARLAAMRTLPGMQVALFDADRRVLAHSDPARPVVRREGDALALASLDDLGEPGLAALQPVRADAPGTGAATREAGGREWKTAVVPVATVRGSLSLGIAVPLDELLKEARAIRARGLAAAVAVLLLALPLTWMMSRRIARLLARLTQEAEDIRAFRFDGTGAGPSVVLEIDKLSGAMDMMRGTIRRFLDVATSLAAETNFKRLLERVVRETSSSTGAAGGLVFLASEDGRTLAPTALVRADGAPIDAATAALAIDSDSPVTRAFGTRRTVVTEFGAGEPAPGLEFAARVWPGARVTVVSMPLCDRAGETLGALVLFVPGGERPSPARLAFGEALSGTAAVAIETQRLLEARKALLDAFIRLVAGAIDAKSPYTGGHCQRVPELTLMLAQAAVDAREGPFRDFVLSDEEWEALQIASWLHDCGKVTTPEYVVDKATKLETIYDRIHEIRTRFEVLKRDAEIACWKRIADGGDRDALLASLARELETLDDEFAFVASCNEGGEFMDPARIERLERIGDRRWLRTLDDRTGIAHEERSRKERFPAPALPVEERLLADKPEHVIPRTEADRLPPDNPWGFRLKVPQLKYNRGELYNLSTGRGTLTEEERYVINHHIVQTIVMLSQLPFPKHLRNVPEIAGGHHEKMDGTGYPKRLLRDEMSWPARMMAIADIFEALTASDRPYKQGKPLSEALKIMSFMKKDGHVDPDLFDLFLRSGAYRRYAERFLQPGQIDVADIAPYLGAA